MIAARNEEDVVTSPTLGSKWPFTPFAVHGPQNLAGPTTMSSAVMAWTLVAVISAKWQTTKAWHWTVYGTNLSGDEVTLDAAKTAFRCAFEGFINRKTGSDV
jgi:hypothetical protein